MVPPDPKSDWWRAHAWSALIAAITETPCSECHRLASAHDDDHLLILPAPVPMLYRAHLEVAQLVEGVSYVGEAV